MDDMKKRILIIFTLFVFALTNSSCDSWLDVTPQAQVNAEKLFSKPKGFENALYGIYTSMTDASSYGTHMTFGLMDVWPSIMMFTRTSITFFTRHPGIITKIRILKM